jgi:hypothetical protein
MSKKNRTRHLVVWSVVGQAIATAILSALFTTRIDAAEGALPSKIGTDGPVGCQSGPKRVKQLVITKPGVYENYLVDGEWTNSTLVKIRADDVVLRHCEIRHGQNNAVTVYAQNVTIESCRIHHVLAGSFDQQDDAHGVTGCPNNLVVRNCDIGLVSGDAIQFDPGRDVWDNVLIDRCTLWTGPLPADAAGFRKGQRPGENAVDTKQQVSNPRSRITIRNCLMSGWNQPGPISNMAALNLKNHVEAAVQNCVLRDNEICFRVRGGNGEYGGAQVSIDHCVVYDSKVAVRAEDRIENLKVRRLGIGSGIERKLQLAGGGVGPGYESVGEYSAPPYETVLESGLSQ